MLGGVVAAEAELSAKVQIVPAKRTARKAAANSGCVTAAVAVTDRDPAADRVTVRVARRIVLSVAEPESLGVASI